MRSTRRGYPVAVERRRRGIIILTAFHGPSGDKPCCCHWNGNPSDNRIDNLRWGTHLDNGRDRARHAKENPSRAGERIRVLTELGATTKDLIRIGAMDPITEFVGVNVKVAAKAAERKA